MWRLIKAEFSYNIYVLIWQYIMLFFTFVSFAWFEKYQFRVEPVIPLLLVVVMFSIFFSRRFTEARSRLFCVLPVNSLTTGMARLLFQLFFWLGALILYVWIYLVFHSSITDMAFVFRLFFWGSTLISANAIYLLSFDLWSGFPKQQEWLKSLLIVCLWTWLVLTGLFYFENQFKPMITLNLLQSGQQWFYFSWSGVFVQYFMGCALSWGSVVLYQRRNDYLN